MFQIKKFFFLSKIVKYIKIIKIRVTSCYDINVTCIYSPKDNLLESHKFEFHVSFWFLIDLKKKGDTSFR